MLRGILALLFLSSALAAWAVDSAKELTGTVPFTKDFRVEIQLQEAISAGNSLIFSREGRRLQTEHRLGDHFVKFSKMNGKAAYWQTADLFGDGRQELFVRLAMIPMGVMRVFSWDPESQKFVRLTFGKKKEDGIPLPLSGPVSLSENGDIIFTGKKRGAKMGKEYRIHWNGSDYELPAKAI